MTDQGGAGGAGWQPSDVSDDLTLGDPQDPSDFIPDHGTDARFTGLADSCFNGNLADCDQLYSVTPDRRVDELLGGLWRHLWWTSARGTPGTMCLAGLTPS